MALVDLLDDPELFAPVVERHDLTAWRAFFKSLEAVPLTSTELATYKQATGRLEAPSATINEAWLVIGRRGGKSFSMALLACYAAMRDYSQYLAAGERATIAIVATDRRQARTIMRYVKGIVEAVEALAGMVESEAAESIDFASQTTIEIMTAGFRSIRGYTIAAALLDELAFWRDDTSANPDEEIIAALRPAMSTIPNAMLIAASSPYAKRGALWNAYREHWGQNTNAICWKASSLTMNPTLDPAFVDAQRRKDPARASAEYDAEFRADVATFVDRELLESLTDPDMRVRPPLPGIAYSAFVDPSGGSADSMTLAIAHIEDGCRVLDLVTERRPPFSPESVVEEFASILKSYGLETVRGDRYAGEWPRERFREHGIEYAISTKTKSDIYRELLPLLNSGAASLLDDPTLLNQLAALERRTARGGRDSIDHPPRAHDDVANAAAGALVHADTTGLEAWWYVAGTGDTPGNRSAVGHDWLGERDRFEMPEWV